MLYGSKTSSSESVAAPASFGANPCQQAIAVPLIRETEDSIKAKPIRVMLVEDQPEYRNAIEIALKEDVDLELVSLFGSAEKALRKAEDYAKESLSDIVLLDLNLPGMSGLDAIPWFRQYIPGSRIIVLTQSDAEQDILEAIRLGASGYLLKSSTVSQIKDSIRQVMSGGATIDDDLTCFLLKTIKTNLPDLPRKISLSVREMEILNLLASGLVKKEIAQQLKISPHTVVTHVSRIYGKLEASNAASAINRAHRLGLLEKNAD